MKHLIRLGTLSLVIVFSEVQAQTQLCDYIANDIKEQAINLVEEFDENLNAFIRAYKERRKTSLDSTLTLFDSIPVGNREERIWNIANKLKIDRINKKEKISINNFFYSFLEIYLEDKTFETRISFNPKNQNDEFYNFGDTYFYLITIERRFKFKEIDTLLLESYEFSIQGLPKAGIIRDGNPKVKIHKISSTLEEFTLTNAKVDILKCQLDPLKIISIESVGSNDKKRKNNSIRRGKNLELQWEGGYIKDSINIELKNVQLKPEKLEKIKKSFLDTTVINTGIFLWTIPNGIPLDKNYFGVVTNESRTEDNSFKSNQFRISRNVPLYIWPLSLGLAGGLIYLGSELFKPPPPLSDLPPPSDDFDE